MSRLLKTLTGVLGYLGRGAVPVDGMYVYNEARPALVSCGANGTAACSREAIVERKFRAGYRVLM